MSGGLGSPAFRGTSRGSVGDLRQRLSESGADAATLPKVATALFGVADVLDEQPTLRRALTDPSREAADRADLARSIFENEVPVQTLELVEQAVRAQWSRVRDLADGLEYLGVFAEVLGADRRGRLDDLEDELFRFGRIVDSDPELQASLSDSTIPVRHRARLASDLLEGKAGDSTVRLVRQAVTAPRGMALLDALEAYAEIAAAWRERLVAIARTAVPLDDRQQERLRGVLTRKYGYEVHLNVIVDSDLIGGIRVEVGDEVIDGSVAARLDEARRKLAG